MKLITKENRLALLANWKNEGPDHEPVIKLFCPWGAATWLLTEMKSQDEDILFGLCDLGMGSPELGYVSRAELEALKGPGSLEIERDRHFRPAATLGVYTEAARISGSIVFDHASLIMAFHRLTKEARESKEPLRASLLNEEDGQPVSLTVFAGLSEIR
jgi:hypothetical protein